MDKTGFIRQLIAQGSQYFLSRPWRFGKSLLLDTIAEVFAGNEALFRGLEIHPYWDWSVRFPVIRLNFAEGVLHSRAALDARIEDLLRINAEALDLTLHPGLDVAGTFGDLIRQGQARHGQRVVVLVDEYDKPILDNLTRPDMAGEMRDGLRNLYSVITGTPTFLVDLLIARGFFTPDLARLHSSEALLSAFDVEHIAPEALLWQTGYLTFHGSRRTGARIEHTLGYPNLEVQTALNDALLKGLMGDPMAAERAQSRLYDTLVAGDFEALRAHVQALFAAIPHHWHDNNPIARYEGFYASVFYSHLAALGLDLTPEDATAYGRIDLTLLFEAQVWPRGGEDPGADGERDA